MHESDKSGHTKSEPAIRREGGGDKCQFCFIFKLSLDIDDICHIFTYEEKCDIKNAVGNCSIYAVMSNNLHKNH